MSLPHLGHFSERLGCRDSVAFRDLKPAAIIAARFGGLRFTAEAAPDPALRAPCRSGASYSASMTPDVKLGI